MGAIARFLLALERLARRRGLKIEDAYKFAKQEFGEMTPLLKKQIENVIRDPDTELERTFKDNPVTGQKATPKDKMTIDEIRDMIQNDPRYDNLTAQQMDMVVRRETTRADFAYNMGIKPEEVDDGVVDLLMMEGYDKRFGFANGGGVGSLFKRKVA